MEAVIAKGWNLPPTSVSSQKRLPPGGSRQNYSSLPGTLFDLRQSGTMELQNMSIKITAELRRTLVKRSIAVEYVKVVRKPPSGNPWVQSSTLPVPPSANYQQNSSVSIGGPECSVIISYPIQRCPSAVSTEALINVTWTRGAEVGIWGGAAQPRLTCAIFTNFVLYGISIMNYTF